MKKYKLMAAIALAVAMIVFGGCVKNDVKENKSIEQLYTENGVPVKIMQLETQDFSKVLEYSGRLSGSSQGTEQSMLSGKIETISFKEGDYVSRDEIVLTFPEDQTGMNYQAVKANYNVTKTSYNRLKELYEEGGISRQELDNIQAAYLAAESQLNTVEQMLRVTSPIDGYITAIYVKETDHVEPGDLLFTVSELKKLKSEIHVSEKEIGLFKKGAPATAKWQGIAYPGKVTDIGFAMNERLGSFEVDLLFDNPNEVMKFNVNALIEVEVYHADNVIVLENKYLSHDRQGDYVYIRNGDKAEKRYVETGSSEGVRFEILSGISAGEEIITEGKELLSDGSLIKVKG